MKGSQQSFGLGAWGIATNQLAALDATL